MNACAIGVYMYTLGKLAYNHEVKNEKSKLTQRVMRAYVCMHAYVCMDAYVCMHACVYACMCISAP